MATKSVRIDEALILKSKERRFQSVNQYLLYLQEFEEAHKRGSYNQVLKSHNKVMTWLEAERLELSQLNAALQLFLEKVDIELQLSQRERDFLERLMRANEKKGTWSYDEKKKVAAKGAD
ncbi:hypothetical protein L0Z36_26235 [Burkholderia multivorans]|uniref:hypothetical protein n=1 Tax=Burkholderiaceae TaxID=119060 RepID=UPI001C21B3E8|nr:hypothetical protein [Burkholderia multivorans]MBU9146916.1 hypothetical protein [Burkholderia multivorans]UQP02918.1 hypothetical protein L0Z36_26235 [Burkholderia multivorans]HEF4774563.1 hypothetical protein [Burkholderia multivorans]